MLGVNYLFYLYIFLFVRVFVFGSLIRIRHFHKQTYEALNPLSMARFGSRDEAA